MAHAAQDDMWERSVIACRGAPLSPRRNKLRISGDQRGVVAPGLVGVCLGKGNDGAVKGVAAAQVAADGRWIAGASMRARQRPATEAAVLDKAFRNQGCEIYR